VIALPIKSPGIRTSPFHDSTRFDVTEIGYRRSAGKVASRTLSAGYERANCERAGHVDVRDRWRPLDTVIGTTVRLASTVALLTRRQMQMS
jgi:hypothetical protein